MSRFYGAEHLKAEQNRALLDTIIKYNGVRLVHRDRDDGVACYNPRKNLPVDYLKKDENVPYSRARASVDVWLGWLVATFQVD